MKSLPKTPNVDELMAEKLKDMPVEKLKKLFSIRIDMPGGVYPHYEKLKRMPPPQGLTPEEHWMGVKNARQSARRNVDLFQKDGSRFWFTEPSCVRARLSRLDKRAAGSIATDGYELNRNEQERYFARSLIEEPFSSSVLEGAATTRQIAKEMIEAERLPRTKDERMVLNNYRAMRYVKSIVNQKLTPKIILDIHRIVCDGTMDDGAKCGVFRCNEGQVTVQDELSGEILHYPPDASQLPDRIQEICDFANTDDSDENFIHPLIRGIIIHFMIGYDHPFVDGNGRTARALFYWYVVKNGYWILEYVSISKTIMKAPSKYGKAYLQTESDYGDLTYFIMHQLDVLEDALKDLFEYVKLRKSKLDAFAHALNDQSINHRQSFVLNEAARNRIRYITIAQHEKTHNVAYLTARKDLEELVSAGYFKKRKDGRENVYIPSPGLLERLTSSSK